MDPAAERNAIVGALAKLRDQDAYVMEINCSERAIAARLQLHLSPLMRDYTVDLEYNRHGIDPKRVHLSNEFCERVSRDGTLVVPDLIVHRRGVDTHNLLVVEIKKADASEEDLNIDREKLRAIRASFTYTHSLLLQLPTGTLNHGRPFLLEWNDLRQWECVS